MGERKFKVLITAAEGAMPEQFLLLPEEGILETAIVTDVEWAREEIFSRKVHAVLMSLQSGAPDPALIIETIRNSPGFGHLPIFVFETPQTMQAAARCLAKGADETLHLPSNDETANSRNISSVLNRLHSIYHPVSLLPTGGVLHNKLSESTSKVPKMRQMLLAKLHGLKAFNVYRTYEDGDNMVAAVSDMLSANLADRKDHDAFLGHLASDEFVIVTSDKRVETLCKSILTKSQRSIRSFYTPYELIQGYISVEAEHYKGRYYLAELMIACAEIPSQWDSHYIFVLDLLKELLGHIEKEKGGYKIISL